MKKAPASVKTLVLLGLVLPALAQTIPSQIKPASPQPARKTAAPNGLVKKYEGPKVAESTEKLGQKFVDKSHEDTSPNIRTIPVREQ